MGLFLQWRISWGEDFLGKDVGLAGRAGDELEGCKWVNGRIKMSNESTFMLGELSFSEKTEKEKRNEGERWRKGGKRN